MANNQLLTMSMVTKEAMRVLENDLAATKAVTRSYDSYFAKSGAKIGNTLNIRKPVRYKGSFGKNLNVEDTIEDSVSITLDKQFHVDIEFDSEAMALSIDEFSDRYIKPAIATIANQIDYSILELTKQVPNAVGNPENMADTLRVYLDAGAKLDSEAAPKDNQRSAIIDEYTQAGLVDNLKSLFQSSEQISDQYKSGNMGIAAGQKFFMDQNVQSHTTGSGVNDTIVVNGANQGGSVLTVSGLSGTLNAGDTFTIAGVFAVNPQSRQSTGRLRQFVVNSVIGGDKISFQPALIPAPEANQNVTNLPANGAAVTFMGEPNQTYKLGIVMHKDAIVLACADLPLPTGDAVQAARVSDSQLGLSIRMIRQYDIATDTWPCRLDILYGVRLVYPELACKVISNTFA